MNSTSSYSAYLANRICEIANTPVFFQEDSLPHSRSSPYTRSTGKAKPKLRSDEFPAHFRRELVTVATPPEQQKLIDLAELLLLRYDAHEVMCYKPQETFVRRYLQPVFATADAPGVDACRRHARSHGRARLVRREHPCGHHQWEVRASHSPLSPARRLQCQWLEACLVR
jgi:hypothetical protein